MKFILKKENLIFLFKFVFFLIIAFVKLSNNFIMPNIVSIIKHINTVTHCGIYSFIIFQAINDIPTNILHIILINK